MIYIYEKDIKKRKVLELLPNNLHYFDIDLSKMVAVKNDKNQIICRSKTVATANLDKFVKMY